MRSVEIDTTPKKQTRIATLQKYASFLKKKIAETVGVSLGAVNRILKQSKETGNVERKRKWKCERKRKTTKRDDAKLLRDSKRNPRKTMEELKRDLDESGVQILSSTIRRRLLAQRRKVRRPKRKQLLTTAMKKKRYNWAKKYKDWSEDDWSRIFFSNESHFFV